MVRGVIMYGRARVPGACGELVQGMIDGDYFLITCPINLGSEVRVSLQPGGQVTGPGEKGKALRAVRLTLDHLAAPWGARVDIYNPLPPGKGLASSTADVVAAAVATAEALGTGLSLETITEIALAVEPSDGTFLPGIVCFDHLQGKRWEYLGQPPPMDVLIVDPGGMVDTVLFNRRRDLVALNLAKEEKVRQAVKLVKEGLARGRADLIARGATISALANQDILSKPELETILELATSRGALGVNTAHSGTVIGILYRPGEVDVDALEASIRTTFPYVDFIRATMVGGGVEGRDGPWFMKGQATAMAGN
ncbi:GHMP kinase [Moorella thermoacetica]|nr:L-threonine kinase [Moorella thermoacetica]AKX96507.1 L-threonine kinase [Moorella thermoacetica]OIQ57677.1 L-threonine kinase [Moorella thermoacetica]OIQ61693.1 L-threonine kinase [Moorella thermoacetica]QDA00321.1 L-threonine kinase [Moorella thermoacetica]